MTDSKTPDWAEKAAFEVQTAAISECKDQHLGATYDYPFVTGRAKEVLDRHIAQALLSAYERGRKEGIEEAAKVAFKQAPATQDWADAPLQDQARRTATAIRQLLEVKG